jgi:hypothetical protein
VDPFPVFDSLEKIPNKPNIDPFPARHVSERNDPNKKPNKPNKLNNVPKNDPKNPKLYNILNGIPASNTNLPRARREPEGYLMLKYFVDEHIVRHLRGPARRSARSMASMMER